MSHNKRLLLSAGERLPFVLSPDGIAFQFSETIQASLRATPPVCKAELTARRRTAGDGNILNSVGFQAEVHQFFSLRTRVPVPRMRAGLLFLLIAAPWSLDARNQEHASIDADKEDSWSQQVRSKFMCNVQPLSLIHI